MLERLEKIEKDLRDIHAEIQKEIPALHNLSFEITTYQSGKIKLHGFYHIGKECKQWLNVSELYDLISKVRKRRVKNAILYQQFSGVV